MCRAWPRALALLLAGTLAACVPAPREEVTSMSAVGGANTVLVGKVELVPPLRKGEQNIRGIVVANVENRIFLISDEKLRPLPRDLALKDYAGRIEAPIGSTFFVRTASKTFYIIGGMLFLDIGGNLLNRAYFPGGLRIAVNAEDRAVYMGTIRYHRNEFWEITKAEIIDEFAGARAEFTAKFGTQQTLRRSLAVPQKPSLAGSARRSGAGDAPEGDGGQQAVARQVAPNVVARNAARSAAAGE